MGNFLEELKRRNVAKVALVYIIAGWLTMQVVDVMFPALHLPEWLISAVAAFVLIGFPFAVIFAWAFEMTPEGLKREKDVDRSDSITPQTGQKLNHVAMIILAIAVVFLLVDKFAIQADNDVPDTAVVATAPEEKPSIAVLPFVNMSGDVENEYFSDGLSEELLNLLAKIPQLHVAGRTSSFKFKGTNEDLRIIGEALNVAHVLEGSVRKSGARLRITAQLIDTQNGYHLWSENYDRELTDIFAIQDEIAATVVKRLKITLLGTPPKVQETNPEAYASYLLGRNLRHQNTAESLEQAQMLLLQASAIDPSYAPVWVELGSVYTRQANRGLRPIDEGFTLAREAINKALAINPDYALAHASLGWIVMSIDNDLVTAARHLERALHLESTNLSIIRKAAHLTASLGRLDEAIALDEYVRARDPVSASAHNNLGLYYLSARRWDEAIVSFSTALTLSPGYYGAQSAIGVTLLLMGDPQAALEAIQLDDSVFGMIGLSLVYHALGQEDESNAVLTELIEQYEQGWAFNIAYVLAYRGEADRAFEWLNKAVEYKDGGLSEILGERLFDNIRDDQRWLPFLERIGKSPDQLAAIEFKVALPK